MPLENCLSWSAAKPDFIIINWLYICTSVLQQIPHYASARTKTFIAI